MSLCDWIPVRYEKVVMRGMATIELCGSDWRWEVQLISRTKNQDEDYDCDHVGFESTREAAIAKAEAVLPGAMLRAENAPIYADEVEP